MNSSPPVAIFWLEKWMTPALFAGVFFCPAEVRARGRVEHRNGCELSDLIPVAEAKIDGDQAAPYRVRIPRGDLTPARAFRRLCGTGPGFILGGVPPEGRGSKPTYVSGPNCRIVRASPTDNPFSVLRKLLGAVRESGHGTGPRLGAFKNGCVGYIGYEAVRYLEPSVSESLFTDPIGNPPAAFFLADEFVVFDSEADHIKIVVNRTSDGSRCVDRAERIIELLAEGPYPADAPHPAGPVTPVALTSQAEYKRRVRCAREMIVDGEAIQIVLSQRVEVPAAIAPLDMFERLAAANPSPYQFYLDFGEFQITGCSPELMVKVRCGEMEIHPIAGTRRRGESLQEDEVLREELCSNAKERAEHVMLLDLARNDVGRVCVPGTVRVERPLHVELYSHVPHLVSRVRGMLAPGLDSVSALEAGFPDGTLTGAPKVMAMQIIGELETEGRGAYCGAVGWFDADGDMETGSIIRSIIVKDGLAHVQAGGGIVYDSEPEAEYRESLQKMGAQLEAVGASPNLL